MRFEQTRCAVVSGHNGDGRIEVRDRGNRSIEFLNAFHLAGKITVLARAIGVFKMDKKEIVILPLIFDDPPFVHPHVLASPTTSIPTSFASPLYIG